MAPEVCDICHRGLQGVQENGSKYVERKHRIKLKNQGQSLDWPLYDTMLEYCKEFEPEFLTPEGRTERIRKSSLNYCKKGVKEEPGEEFIWSKDITETFIQLRLQNDCLFRERKWAWNDMLEIMINNYGFPKTLTGRDIARKWSSTYSDYQKSKATNNKSWVYYTLFELYLGEGKLTLNPAADWQEEWVSCLIDARTENEILFRDECKNLITGWREVERRLRISGVPLDHSLLEIPEIWTHLERTYKFKKKFATKGILTEQWPFYEAMSRFEAIKIKSSIKKQKKEKQDYTFDTNDAGAIDDDDCEDDMKLFDLKQKLEQVKPKIEYIDANQCRSCANEEGCVSLFNHLDQDGVDLAHKLRIVGGVEVTSDDALPSLICLHCLRELENAYKFRQICQNVDKTYRSKSCNIKTETSNEEPVTVVLWPDNDNDIDDKIINDSDNYETDFQDDSELKDLVKKQPPKLTRRRKKKYRRYEYTKICEICGKHTTNLKSHVDAHSNDKAYSCDVCNKKFKFKSGLLVHKAVHDPTPKKTCEVCGKTFHILAQYRRHFVYHANERKYECETCGKRFNTIDILKVHNRIHTDERPFTCSDCGKTFRTAGCVSRHKRIVHKTKRNEQIVQ